MASIDKADIKLGFWIGVGLMLLGIVLGLIRWLLSKAAGHG